MNEEGVPLLSEIISQASLNARTTLRVGAPFVIAIAGGSASGKTTLTRQLAQNLGEGEVTVFQQDDFQLGWDFEEQVSSPYRWDDPRNYTPFEVRQALISLRSGKSTTIPRFDLASNVRVGTRIVKPAPFVVFEGLYALADDFRDCVDDSIYVSAPLYARFLRRIFRFMSEVGPAKGSVAVRHMVNFVVDAHRKFVAPQQVFGRQVFHAPYDFEQETVRKFSLGDINMPVPGGALESVFELPSEVALKIYSTGGEHCNFAIDWRGRVVFACQIDRSVARKMHELDWFGL